ncbi:MAG: site-2 protease family protein [Actinobacteria bacterium]|nr:site-2 protease family protein [Actinomycetota bacterium]
MLKLLFIVIAVLGIGFLILVHELGHFLAAKAFGMRAEKFYLGFPPAAVKKKIGETEYGIGFIPLGGYVKISGMTREEELPDDVKPRAYVAKPVWQRIIVISAGAGMNLLFAGLFFFIVFWQGIPDYEATVVVADIQADSGADRAGIEPGDRVLAINEVVSDRPEDLREELRSRPDQTISLVVERDDQQLTIPAAIGRNEETGEGILGIVFEAEVVGYHGLPFTEAVSSSFSRLWEMTGETFIAIKNLFISEQSRKDLSSPIGIVAFSSKTVEMGWSVYLTVLGFISLQLAIFNLLPFLPLDGGHVLFNILEKIKGSPIRREVFERVSIVGLMLFALLFLTGIMNDIERIQTTGFDLQP